MNDRYKVLETIDSTSYGRISKVEDQLLGQVCICKTVYKSSNPTRLYQWRSEVRVLSEIQSTYVPKLLDVIEDENALTLVESYIPGIDLEEWLSKQSLFSNKKKRKLFIECLSCIQSVHDAGYLYIDIKPSNCLVSDCHLYLIDFNSCIEIHSKHVLSASKENLQEQFFDQNPKGIQSDLMGLLNLYRRFFPFSITSRIISRGIRWHLVQNTKYFELWIIWFLRLKRVLSILLISILSVFLLTHSFQDSHTALSEYKKQPNAQTFFKAYHASKKDYDSYQVLYEWISQGLIYKDVWNEKSVAIYLLEESILIKDPQLIQNVLSNIPKSIQNEHIFTVLEAKICMHQSFDSSDIQRAIEQVSNSQQFYTLFQLLNQSKSLLDGNQMKLCTLLAKKYWNQLNYNGAKIYLEYSLFLLSKGESELQLTDTMAKKWINKKEFKEMYSLWKEGQ